MSVSKRSHRRRAIRFAEATIGPDPATTSTRIAKSSSPHSSRAPDSSKRTIDFGNESSELAAPWPRKSRPPDSLKHAEHQPALEPNAARKPSDTDGTTKPGTNTKGKKKMAEPRARAARHKGQMNFPSECPFALYLTVSLSMLIR